MGIRQAFCGWLTAFSRGILSENWRFVRPAPESQSTLSSCDLCHILKVKRVGLFRHASQPHHSTIRSSQVKQGENPALADDPSRLRCAGRISVSHRQRDADATAQAENEFARSCPGAV